MPSIIVDIVRMVDLDFPGFVECQLLDVDGKTWTFVEKVPVVTTGRLNESSRYPVPGQIRCEVVSLDHARATVDTARPDGVEAADGTTRFTVHADQLIT